MTGMYPPDNQIPKCPTCCIQMDNYWAFYSCTHCSFIIYKQENTLTDGTDKGECQAHRESRLITCDVCMATWDPAKEGYDYWPKDCPCNLTEDTDDGS